MNALSITRLSVTASAFISATRQVDRWGAGVRLDPGIGRRLAHRRSLEVV